MYFVKKKILFLLFLFGFFFYMPNVFADEFDVCRDGCDYQTLDQALTAAETTNNVVYIRVYDYDSYTITNHSFNHYVNIIFDDDRGGTITIDGNGSTLRSNYEIQFYANYGNHDLKLNNIQFVSNYLYDQYFLSIYYFMNIEMSNIQVKAMDTDSTWSIGINIENNNESLVFDSISVEGFSTGISLYLCSSTTIQNSDLIHNIFSLSKYDYNHVKVINTDLSFVYLCNSSLRIDDLGSKTIKTEEVPYFNSDSEWQQWNEQVSRKYDNKEYEDYLYIYYEGAVSASQFKKSVTIKDDSFNLLDVWFYDNG